MFIRFEKHCGKERVLELCGGFELEETCEPVKREKVLLVRRDGRMEQGCDGKSAVLEDGRGETRRIRSFGVRRPLLPSNRLVVGTCENHLDTLHVFGF